ncbi:MAG: carbonic anhydrase [Legionellales bacterium]|nr:carbonic anhydrase [Legionellales bacterium]
MTATLLTPRLIAGYQKFREKYVAQDQQLLKQLAKMGQHPSVLVLACSDSRVDPAILLQCDPGEIFVIRNVANIVPPYERDSAHHGTSAALEFGICYLNIKHLMILGHSQCGGIEALTQKNSAQQNDFINNWVNLINLGHHHSDDSDECAQLSLLQSYQHCLTFPWIKERLDNNTLTIDLCFFAIDQGLLSVFDKSTQRFVALA